MGISDASILLSQPMTGAVATTSMVAHLPGPIFGLAVLFRAGDALGELTDSELEGSGALARRPAGSLVMPVFSNSCYFALPYKVFVLICRLTNARVRPRMYGTIGKLVIAVTAFAEELLFTGP